MAVIPFGCFLRKGLVADPVCLSVDRCTCLQRVMRMGGCGWRGGLLPGDLRPECAVGWREFRGHREETGQPLKLLSFDQCNDLQMYGCMNLTHPFRHVAGPQ